MLFTCTSEHDKINIKNIIKQFIESILGFIIIVVILAILALITT